MVRVDILLVTYNHHKYIRQALDGILMQRHAFHVHLVVADDCSTDGTPEIIRHCLEGAPMDVEFIERESNVGFQENYREAFRRISGDFVFVLEGDDYWVDPERLRKHVDVFTAYPECNVTMNRYAALWEETGEIILSSWDTPGDLEFIRMADQIGGNKLGNLSACGIRASAWRLLSKEVFSVPAADWLIGMALAEQGTIGLLKEPMSVYRKLKSGLWSGFSRVQELTTLLQLIDQYDAFFDNRYHVAFSEYRNRVSAELSLIQTKNPGKQLTMLEKIKRLFQAH